MRHGKKNNHLGRTDTHRKAMLANMASSLILHKRITTTVAKAKALRVYVEPLITKSKNDTTHSRRTVFSYLQNKDVVSMLFREVAEKVATRPGGYTRILKLQNRLGDNAEMALIELVDYNEIYKAGGVAAEKKTTRRRGSKGKKSSTSASSAVIADETAIEDKEPVTDVEVQEEQQNQKADVAPTLTDATPAADTVQDETESPKKEE